MKEEQSHSNSEFGEQTKKLLQESGTTLHVPEYYFEARAALLESALNESLEVPAGFFQEQSGRLNKQLQLPTGKAKGKTVRLWVALAAAAVTVGILFIVVPGKEETLRFSEQLEQTPIEFEDLEELDFDEEVYEEFIIVDTLKSDTSSIVRAPSPVQDFKPSKGQSVISWDDISAEDIEEYLKEEETIEIIDEL
jgi:hypothetical protein